MPKGIIEGTESQGFRARRDRFFQSGRVIGVNSITHTAIIDVGAGQPNGDAVYLHNVPYNPQQPPNLNDTVTINYTNVSPHSAVISGMSVGTSQSSQIVSSGVAVTGLGSLHVTQAGNIVSITDVPISNPQTGTTYTAVLTDAYKILEMNNAAAIALTLPPSSSVAWVVGTQIEVWQQGAGQVTITPGAGVTLRSNGAKYKTLGQYSTIRLRYRAANEWVLSGDLSV